MREREIEKMRKRQRDIKRMGKGKMSSKGVTRQCKTEQTRGKGREVVVELYVNCV